MHSAEALGAILLWSEDLNPGQRFGALEGATPFKELSTTRLATTAGDWLV
ncbi:MAG: hypothetical protein LC775_17705 [Acidobacteria bacterium]|nr:hypothetical protein [Acidobacteriota bacterium]